MGSKFKKLKDSGSDEQLYKYKNYRLEPKDKNQHHYFKDANTHKECCITASLISVSPTDIDW